MNARTHLPLAVLVILGVFFASPLQAAEGLSATSAQLQLTIAGGRATGQCLLVFEKTGESSASCPVFSGKITPTQIDLSPGLSFFGTDTLSAIATLPGTSKATLTFNIPIVNQTTSREITLPVPLAATTVVKVSVLGENAEIKSDAALQTTHTPEGTYATLYPGKAQTVRIILNPGFALKEGKPKLAAEIQGRLYFKDGTVYLAADYRCERLSGQPGEFDLDLPDSWTLEQLTGPDIASWHPQPTQSQQHLANYHIRYNTENHVRFSLLCSVPVGFSATSLPLHFPMPRQAVRANGNITLSASQQTTLSAEELSGARPGEDGLSVISPQVNITLRSQPRRFAYDCDLSTASVIKEQVLSTRGRLQINVREGGRYRLILRAAPGLRLNSLSGGRNLRWRQEGERVTIDQTERISGRLLINFTSELTANSESYPLPWLLPEEQGTQNITAAFSAPEGYEILRSGTDDHMTQIGVSTLAQWMQPAQLALSGETIPSGFALSLRKSPPAVEALCYTQARMEDERLQMSCNFTIMPKRIAVFRHQIFLGTLWDITAVTGELIRDWEYAPDTGILAVSLVSACPERYQLQVLANRPIAETAGNVTLNLPYYEDATMMRGFVSATPSTGWSVALGQTNNARPCTYQEIASINPTKEDFSAQHQNGALLLAYLGDHASAQLTRRRIPTELRANENCILSFSPGLVRLEATLQFAVTHGSVKALCFRPPAGFTNIEISSVANPTTNQSGQFRPEEVWQDKEGFFHIDFPARLDRLPPIRIHGERTLPADGLLSFTPIQILNCGRTNGTLTIYKPTGEGGSAIDIQESVRDGFHRVLTSPPATGGVAEKNWIASYSFDAETASICYRIIGTGLRILQAAKATECELSSRLTDTGDLLTRLRCRIENPGGQQFLSLDMPEHAKVWGTFANGDPIKPVQDRNSSRLLVPLIAGTGQKRFDLDIIYEQRMPSDRFGYAQMRLETPQLSDPGVRQGMQIDQTRWKLWVPDDYALISHGGTLNMTLGKQANSSYLLDFCLDLGSGLIGLLDGIAMFALRGLLWLLPRLLPVILVGLVVWLVVRTYRSSSPTNRFAHTALSVFLLIAVILGILGMLTGPLMNARVSALKVSSASNLSQIGKAIYIYSSPSYYSTPPATFENLLASGLIDNQKLMESPLGGTYAYAGISENCKGSDIVAVELLDDPSPGSANVLYYDGHVKALKNEEVVQALENSRNYTLLNRFVDNWQQERYSRQASGRNWGGKTKQLASLSREAEEQQLALQNINAAPQQEGRESSSDMQQRLGDVSVLNMTQEQAARRDVKQFNYATRGGVRKILRRRSNEENQQNESATANVAQAPASQPVVSEQIANKGMLTVQSEIEKAEEAPTEGKEFDVKISSEVKMMLEPKQDSAIPEPPASENTMFNAGNLSAQTGDFASKRSATKTKSMVAKRPDRHDDTESASKGEASSFTDEFMENKPQSGRSVKKSAQSPAAKAEKPAAGADIPAAAPEAPPVPATSKTPGPARARAPLVAERATPFFVSTAAGALPISVEIPDNGAYLEFARGAASDRSDIKLCFFSRGFSIAMEIIVALGLAGMLLWIRRKYHEKVLPFAVIILILAVVALQWGQSSYQPQLIAAIAVALITLLLHLLSRLQEKISRYMQQRLNREYK